MKDEPSISTSNADDADYCDTGSNSDDLPATLRELLEETRIQTKHLSEIQIGDELEACLLEKIGRIVCMTANEAHAQTQQFTAIRESFEAFLEMYKCGHPDQALQLEKFARLRAEMEKCCPPEEKPELICQYEPCEPHGGIRVGDGYSTKSRGFVNAVQVGEEHEPWTIQPGTLNEDDEGLPQVLQGPLVGPLVPAAATPHVLDFRSGGGAPPGGQEPVTFRTFSESGVTTGIWPPDMSGAKGGDVVVMSGNLWLKLSLDSGKTFSDVKFNDIFAADKTYGGWAGDQVIHYVPQIDCFVLYVQSGKGAQGSANQSKSVVKVALASPADLKTFKGGKAAWRRQWDFTSDDFGLNAWLDFPDLTYGDAYLYINTNTFLRTYDSAGQATDAFQGKLFFELPLKELQAGSGFGYSYALCTDKLSYGSPTQNIGDENYWAAHIDNSAIRIYSSKGSDPNYFWRERTLNSNWPLAALDKNNARDIISAAPDSGDWISEDHRIIGATRVNNQLWFAWSAAAGDGGSGGFKFPQAHVQIAKFDIGQDYKLIEQAQVWNADIAFAYPSLTTNSNNEVGISLAWGGGKNFGSHAVGILGDFVLWFGEASDRTSTAATPTRFGDYLHVRLAHQDTRFFSAFGYAVRNDSTFTPPERADYLYVEFGREAIAPSPLH
jgi:hypothetical protein